LEDQQETLVRMGEEAELLLKADSFNSTVNSLVDSSFQNFCNSKAEDKEQRERSYHHYRALVDIVATLQQRVAVKDEILSKAAEEQKQGNE
jgi:hypothetical protein